MNPKQRQNMDLALADFVEHMQAYARSPRTIENYTRDVRSFLTWLAEETDIISLAEITAQTIGSYQVGLLALRTREGRPLSTQTQSLRLEALKSFLGWLTREGKLLMSPASAVQLPKRYRPLPDPMITAREAIAMLESIDTSTPLGARDRAMLEVFYSSGMRNSELRNLEIDDFDPHNQTLSVREGKGRKGRVVPIGPVACETLERYIAEARPLLLIDPEETRLFISYRGRKLRRDDVALIVARCAKKAGLTRPIRPHRLRHACATHMIAGGADIRHIQELLGHASLATTQIYTRVEIGGLKAAHQRFHPRESKQPMASGAERSEAESK